MKSLFIKSRHEPLEPCLETPGAASLARHSEQFPQEVREVAPGVHVAIGFGLANSILLAGEQGAVIVDCLESPAAARPVKERFNALCPAPVRALIYTHNHADHIFGSKVMAGDDQPEVYAHETTRDQILTVLSLVRPAVFTRSMRQFGTCLEPGEHLNCGIGPTLKLDAHSAPAVLWPTQTVAKRLEVEIAGRRIELGHVPGESPDHLYVWLPEQRLLIPGDNYYHAFPNLYAIRGTAYRDVLDWVCSLETLMAFDAEVLVPCHTQPVCGREEIRRRLESYRDAILFVHDQTIRGMNLGLPLDEIVARVRLPVHLAGLPWLQEHYGRVSWSVRSIYTGTLGWFDGDAAHLDPLGREARARHMVELAGSVQKLRSQAQQALAEAPRWALELADHLLALDAGDRSAQQVRAAALRSLGEAESSANGRNYYLTQAAETVGRLKTPRFDPARAAELLPALPIEAILRSLAVHLDAEAASDVDVLWRLCFTDLQEDWTFHIRRGVALVARGKPARVDVELEITSTVFKELLVGLRKPAQLLARGQARVRGGHGRLVALLLLFDTD